MDPYNLFGVFIYLYYFIRKMQTYVVFLIFVIVFVIIVAFINDINEKKNRNGKKDKNMNSDAERNGIGKKWKCMDKYQRSLTQTLSSGFR